MPGQHDELERAAQQRYAAAAFKLLICSPCCGNAILAI
jgi:hypothetical protein